MPSLELEQASCLLGARSRRSCNMPEPPISKSLFTARSPRFVAGLIPVPVEDRQRLRSRHHACEETAQRLLASLVSIQNAHSPPLLHAMDAGYQQGKHANAGTVLAHSESHPNLDCQVCRLVEIHYQSGRPGQI